MSQQLQVWCEKLQKEVTEGVPLAVRIKLMTVDTGTVFETWEPVSSLSPADWAADAEALLSSLKIELPKRRVSLVFVAEAASGSQVANHLRGIVGENPQAQDLGTQNGAKALADAMTAVQKLQTATLDEARKMLEFQAQQLERCRAEVDSSHEFFMAIRQAELESTENESAFNKVMTEQLQGALPLIMQVVQHWATSPGKGLSGATAAAAAAATTSNGVS